MKWICIILGFTAFYLIKPQISENVELKVVVHDSNEKIQISNYTLFVTENNDSLLSWDTVVNQLDSLNLRIKYQVNYSMYVKSYERLANGALKYLASKKMEFVIDNPEIKKAQLVFELPELCTYGNMPDYIMFDDNSDKIDTASIYVLRRISDHLDEFEDLTLVINGRKMSTEKDMLDYLRTKSVYDYLIELKVDSSRLILNDSIATSARYKGEIIIESELDTLRNKYLLNQLKYRLKSPELIFR